MITDRQLCLIYFIFCYGFAIDLDEKVFWSVNLVLLADMYDWLKRCAYRVALLHIKLGADETLRID